MPEQLGDALLEARRGRVGEALLVSDLRLGEGWERVRALLAARQGYLGSRLYRSPEPTGCRFVAVVRWSSPLMYARALQQPEITDAAAALPFPFQSALYLAVSA